MADCKKYSRVPSEYQELTNISNSGTQYIDTGLKGSDLADCELEIVMRNDTGITSLYNFNGTYLSGSTAQFGLVATSNSECRSSINFGFADAISTTGLSLYEFHTLYVTNGLQKVDNTVVGTLNFGTLNDGNFLLFARTDPNQGSGVNICQYMSLKSFTVKRNNQYIRNMIPVRRKSDSQLGLYDLTYNVFYTNQGTGSFLAGADVNNWQHSLRKLTTATDTLTTLPADIYADGTNATVGLKGNMRQTGTPTPSSPIQPSETGDRTGNLFSSTWEQGSINGTTGQNEPSTTRVRTAGYIEVSPNKIYSFTRSIYNEFMNVRFYSADKSFIGVGSTNTIRLIAGHDEGNPMYIGDSFCCFEIIDSNIKYMRIGDQCNNLSTKYMMVEGQYTAPTMPVYEPYGYKIPISSASTTTPVYLGEVQTERKIKKLVLTGDEDWYVEESDIFYTDPISEAVRYTPICSHFIGAPTLTGNNQVTISKSLRINIMTTAITHTATDFKTYLQQQYAAGTPVTVWYVLATPTTGIVNEPLRKIGDYVDIVSGISIPTITGKDTVDVETTLKPSEVSLSYTGWHNATDKEWDGSQWT